MIRWLNAVDINTKGYPMHFLLERKSLFYDIESEMIRDIKSQFFWLYYGFKLCDIIVIASFILGASSFILSLYVSTQLPAQVANFANTCIHFCIWSWIIYAVAILIYSRLYDKLQPIVRLAARSLHFDVS